MNRVRVLSAIGALALICSAGHAQTASPHANDPWDGAFGHEGTVKVRVPLSDLASALKNAGTSLVAEYESFAVIEAPIATAPLVANGEVMDSENLILLNTGSLDTSSRAVRQLQSFRGAFNGRTLHLVQFAGPVQPSWLDQLAKTGVQIITYIPSNAYLVYADAAQLTMLQVLAATDPHIQWNGAYEDTYKIDPEAVVFMAKAAGDAGAAGAARADAPLFAVQLVKDDVANKQTVALIDSVRTGPVLNSWDVLEYHNVIAPIPPAQLQAIAAQPDVISIQAYGKPVLFDERQDQIVAGNLTGNNPSAPGYLAWLMSKGFTQAQFNASNIIVDVTDSGIDNGTTSPNHFGLYAGGVRPGTSRVVYNRLVGTPNAGSTLQGCDGHGNLNTHIVLGYDDVAGFPFVDASNYHFGLGVCPWAKAGSSVIFDPNSFTSPNYTTLQSTAYNSGARISTNSWGNTSGNTYTVDSQTYDSLVRDAQPTGSAFPAAGNQEMVIVFAAGNSGSGANTVHPPATGKNLITVGAAENVQAFGGSDGCATADTDANSANDIATFSSRGPCSDNRKKPEIVAPGTHVSGGVAQTASPSGTGTANACYTGSGVCGGVGSIYFPSSGQQFYTASSGTSHSTPAVAGGCALIRQFFINQSMTPPSPAMTKAVLMNAARYMNGVGANDALWSNNQGMGEMNLGEIFNRGAVTPTVFRDQIASDTFTASGQSRTFTGVIADSSKPFRVTLAWTDAPGATSGAAAKNNLDLTVTIGANTYKGNVFTGANSVTGGAADTLNNVESVFLPAGTVGAYTVTVTGTNINSDGVPNSGGAIDQDFAMVLYNGTASNAVALTGTGADAITDVTGNGNANGRIDPGESAIQLTVPVVNNGNINATGVSATLVSNTPTVTVTTATAAYPNLALGGGTGSNATTYVLNVSPSHVCGAPISLTLNINSVQGSGSYAFSLPTGLVSSGGPFTTSYTGPAVAIPDNNPTGATASVTVSGLSGTIADVNLRFDGSSCNATAGSTTVGLDHTYLADLTITLQSPTGTVVTLMSAAGGSGNNLCGTLLDDEASSPIQGITAAGNPWTGSFTPNSPLSAFDGQSPNGLWTLKVVDGAGVDTGNIRAFSVIIGTNNPATCTPPNSSCTGASVASGPNGATVCAGAPASFTVNAAGTGPFTYQWRKNTSTIGGAVSSTYSIPVTTAGSAGTYDCVVTNACGSATSTGALLTVNTAPAVTGNPSGATVCAGSPASFSVTASGTPAPAFQWRKNTVNISGANAATYNIPSTVPGDTGSYDCVVTNSCGSASSTAAALSVTSPCCDSIDFNNDSFFPDTLDIDDFLSVFSGGPCTNDPNCHDIDFNNDGFFPDTTDIDSLLSVFSGGPCI